MITDDPIITSQQDDDTAANTQTVVSNVSPVIDDTSAITPQNNAASSTPVVAQQDDTSAANGQNDAGNSAIVIPDAVKENFPDLIPQIMASPSMDDKERNYWFSVLSIMSTDQVTELRDILASEQKRLQSGGSASEEEVTVDLEQAERDREAKRQNMKVIETAALASDSSEADSLLADLAKL